MNFKQTYRSGSMNVVMDSEKKVLSNRSKNPQSDKRLIKEFLFPFLEKKDCFASVPNRRKEGQKITCFCMGKPNCTKYHFCAKKSLVLQCTTK